MGDVVDLPTARLYDSFVSRPVDTVIEFLKAEEVRGNSHVFLDDDAREGLRELFKRSREPVVKHDPATPAPPPAPVSVAAISGASKAEQLEGLRQQAEQWAPARSLGTLRKKMVFGVGNPDADLMLVGEYPGYNEEREGEPFIGPAGQKLNDILKAMGLKREEVYLTSLVKFRPALPRQTTNNRQPSPEEIAVCLPLLMAEITVVRPKCVITLGPASAEGLLGLERPITGMRGKWHEVSGVPVRATFHPSHLLQSSNEVKRALWEDMLAAMELLEIPISEKQRAFFLPKA